jgi:broad-specificity NMP kinase
MKPSTFFITGTSGAGKSTIVRLLKKRLPSTDVRDFDEGGVPPDVDEHWRIKRTEYWLQRAQKNKLKGISTVICGVCVPKEIQCSPSYDSSLRVHYGLLHITPRDIRQRLGQRGWSKKQIDANIRWALRLSHYIKATRNRYVVEGKGKSPQQIADDFALWIRKKIIT